MVKHWNSLLITCAGYRDFREVVYAIWLEVCENKNGYDLDLIIHKYTFLY